MAGCVSGAPRSTRSRHPAPASSRLEKSTTGRPVRDCDSAPNSASWRRTARDTPDSDSVPRAPATTGFRLRLPPPPVPVVRTLTPHTRPAPVQSVPGIRPHGADPTRLQALQQLTALVILQPTVGPFPIQQLADGSGDLGHSQTGIVLRHCPHQLHFLHGECAPAKCHLKNRIRGKTSIHVFSSCTRSICSRHCRFSPSSCSFRRSGGASARLPQVPACLSSGTEVPRRLKPAPHFVTNHTLRRNPQFCQPIFQCLMS